MADQVLFGGFRRLGKFALDPTSVAPTLQALNEYIAKDPTAYDGQQVIVTNDPNEKNNGTYSIIFKTEVREDGSSYNVLIPKQSANMEQVREKILEESKRIEDEIVLPIKEFIGMPTDNSKPEENSGNNILSRISKIENLLELDDDDENNNKISSLKEELKNLSDDLLELSDRVGNEKLAEIFATKEEKEQIEIRIDELEKYIDLLDNGKIDEVFKDVIKALKDIEEQITDIRNNITTIIENFRANFEQMLSESFNNGSFKNLVALATSEDHQRTIDNASAIIAINETQTQFSNTLSGIENNLENLESNISTKLESSKFEEFKVENNKKIVELTTNTKKTVFFEFGEGKDSFLSLPSRCTITEIRVVIDTITTDDELTGIITLDEGESFINKNELYFDSHYEIIIEKIVKTIVESPIIRIIAQKEDSNGVWFNVPDFAGSFGRVFITYY